MPLDVSPPRATRFRSPLAPSGIYWVRPEFVVSLMYLTWTDTGPLWRVVYKGLATTETVAGRRF